MKLFSEQEEKLAGNAADEEGDVDNNEKENNEAEQKPKDTQQDNTKKDKGLFRYEKIVDFNFSSI